MFWGINPTFLCSVPGFMFFLFHHQISWVGLLHTSQSLYGGHFVGFYPGRGVAIGPNILWSTPFSIQQSTLGTTFREFPRMPKWVVLGRHVMVYIECIHTVLPQKQCTGRISHADRYTGQPVHPRYQSVQCLPTNQNSSTSMGVSSGWVLCSV